MSHKEQLSKLKQYIEFALMTATKSWQSVPEEKKRKIISDTDGDGYLMCFPHTSRGTYYNADIWYCSLSKNNDSITIAETDDATTTALHRANTFFKFNYDLTISNIGIAYANPRTIDFGVEFWNDNSKSTESVRRKFHEDLMKVFPEYEFIVS